MRNTFLYYCDDTEAKMSGFHAGVAEAICLRAEAAARRHKCDSVAILAYGREVHAFIVNPNTRKVA